jgi:hypothetical protein
LRAPARLLYSYTPGCPTNQYRFSPGRGGGREQITCWCCSSFVYTTARTTRMKKPLNPFLRHVLQSPISAVLIAHILTQLECFFMRLCRHLECGNSVCLPVSGLPGLALVSIARGAPYSRSAARKKNKQQTYSRQQIETRDRQPRQRGPVP